MTRLRSLCLLCVSFGLTLAVVQSVEAQVVRNTVEKVTRDYRETRRDYVWDKPFQYQPSDPWYRGKVFKVHTGHYGFFYNCDGEECKRESPYICWKDHTERDFPCWKRPRWYINQDLNEVAWRIGNGSCCPQAPCAQGCTSCINGGYSIGSKSSGAVPIESNSELSELVSGPPVPGDASQNPMRQLRPFDNLATQKSFGKSPTQNNATCDCEQCVKEQRVAELPRFRR